MLDVVFREDESKNRGALGDINVSIKTVNHNAQERDAVIYLGTNVTATSVG